MRQKRSKSKYNAIKTTYRNITFASKVEAEYYQALLLREKAGEVSDIKLQPKFNLIIAGKPILLKSEGYPGGRKVYYLADFSFIDNKTGKVVIVDVKGMDTMISRLKRAIVENLYGIEIIIVRKNYESKKSYR